MKSKLNFLILIFLVSFLIVVLIFQNIDMDNEMFLNKKENIEVTQIDLEKDIISKENFDNFLTTEGYVTDSYDESFNEKYFNLSNTITCEDILVKNKDTEYFYYVTYYSNKAATDVFNDINIDNTFINTGYYNYNNITFNKDDKTISVYRVNNSIIVYVGQQENQYENIFITDKLENN